MCLPVLGTFYACVFWNELTCFQHKLVHCIKSASIGGKKKQNKNIAFHILLHALNVE